MFILLLPYVWVLPVHFIGTRWPRMNGKAFGVMPWGLKDFLVDHGRLPDRNTGCTDGVSVLLAILLLRSLDG